MLEDWCDARSDDFVDIVERFDTWWHSPRTRTLLTAFAVLMFLLVFESLLFYG